ncbi:MAG: VWA domain-containing protein [Gammaproteobacteria bacterium]|nr:VWA domain-containing protein [Gammaproteobacteria bacterium]
MTISSTQSECKVAPQKEEPGDINERFSYLIDQGKSSFSGEYFHQWEQACNKLANAGYGSLIPLSYVRESPKLANLLSAEIAINFVSLVSLSAIKLNRAASELLPKSAIVAAQKLSTIPEFLSWVSTIEVLIKAAPESVLPVLERTQKILTTLTPEQFRSWALAGLRSTDEDKNRQIQYFSFADPESEKWFRHEAGDVVFTDIDRRLKLYLVSLWNLRPPIRDLPASTSPLSLRRISISNGVVRIPEVFPGFHGDQAEKIFRAGLAHVGAHLVYSTKVFPVAELKPIQIALISLLEDARVEYLAMQAFPGLKELWLPLHVAKASGPKLVPHLLARLSRALIDSEFKDRDGWVQKGRDMFFDKSNNMSDPIMCRKLGVLLGNDLGQMRAQFNSKTYVVEPPYRDDNLGLWDFGDQQGDEEDNEGVFIEAVQMDQKDKNDDTSSDLDRNEEDQTSEQQYNARQSQDDEVRESEIAVRYPEFDYLTGYERPNWTCVVEYFPDFGDAYLIDRILETHRDLVNRITQLIQSAKVSLPERLHRQSVGESLDIDACIDAVVSRRMGQTPDPRIYSTTERKHRDLSVQVLLDISNSTNDIVPNTNESVLQVEIQATSLLAYAMTELGDPFGIAAFCSDGKEDVHYYRIKNFNDEYDKTSRAYLAGLKGKLSTRMGAAMRHAVKELTVQQTHRRLLLIITDGEPSDIDVQDKNYLVEDARKVVRSASHMGIDTFCVGLEASGENYLTKIFGKKNVVLIDEIDRLPQRLPMLYLRLTA